MSRKGLVRLGILGVSLILAVSLLFIACAPAQVQTVEWRAHIEEAEGTPEWNYMQHAADEIFARSDGEVRITLYPEESLGYEGEQLIDVIGQGLLEIAVLRAAHGAGQIPMLNLGDLPFLQDNAEQANTVTDAIFPYYDEALEDFGVHALSMWKSAPTGVTSKVNINTLEAWKGVKLRAWSPTLVDLSNLLGVSPVQMPYSEAFSGLATGIIDGIFWPPSSALSVKTFDAGAMYYDQWNIFTMTSAALIGDKALKSVSPSAQKIIMEVFPELVDEAWENEYWGFKKDYEGLREHGVEIVFVDPAEIDKVRAKTSVIWDKSLEKSGAEGLEALNAVLKALGRPAYK